MSLKIRYDSEDFPSTYGIGSGVLSTSWDELLWAALTVGRPNTAYVFQHGEASLYEVAFRLSLIRMAVEQNYFGELNRTTAFAALDPTEKGMVNYFLGMTLCKLFASRFLSAPWILHLDVFRDSLNPLLLGRSRPDLVGRDASGNWHAFESKGRSGSPSNHDIEKAKGQAQRLVEVNGIPCSLHIGTFSYFKSQSLHFYWCDPEPQAPLLRLLSPEQEWRYYYEPAFSLLSNAESSTEKVAMVPGEVVVEAHPDIHQLLSEERWTEAYELARRLQEQIEKQGFQPDGLRVKAGDSWQQPLENVRQR